MRGARTILALALLTSACDARSGAEKARADARDIALVEAVQNVPPPMIPVTPEAIAYADIEQGKLHGVSCVFKPEGQDGYVALAMADAAYLKLKGSLRVFAADKGSPPLPLGSWTRYEGREHVLDLQIADGANENEGGSPSGDETTDWPGRLTIRDPYQRVVYSAAGIVQCGS